MNNMNNMTDSEKIVAELIDKSRITGADAIILLRGIYGKEQRKTTQDFPSPYITTTTPNPTWNKHADVLCISNYTKSNSTNGLSSTILSASSND